MSLYNIDLQLFTGEKTEQATPKRKKEAREKGQILQTKEINSAFILLFAFLTLNFISRYLVENVFSFYANSMEYSTNIDSLLTLKNINSYFVNTLFFIIKLSLPILLSSLIVGLMCSYFQVGFLFTTKTLTFKLDRINPISGFKKMLSLKSLVELLKSLFKIILLIYVTSSYLVKQYKNILNVFDLDTIQTVTYLWSIIFNIVIRSSGILLFLAILDYIYKKWEYEKDLKMSKQEIKEEYKQMEGDPLIKSKIKEKQRQISMSRMMQDVPKADVIITNPTHYAIGIAYNNDNDEAPKVIAKGRDLIAQNIKKIGKENDVPIVENKPLAQALYKTVEIGELIPADLYQAVAEVLAYVYNLKNSY